MTSMGGVVDCAFFNGLSGRVAGCGQSVGGPGMPLSTVGAEVARERGLLTPGLNPRRASRPETATVNAQTTGNNQYQTDWPFGPLSSQLHVKTSRLVAPFCRSHSMDVGDSNPHRQPRNAVVGGEIGRWENAGDQNRTGTFSLGS